MTLCHHSVTEGNTSSIDRCFPSLCRNLMEKLLFFYERRFAYAKRIAG